MAQTDGVLTEAALTLVRWSHNGLKSLAKWAKHGKRESQKVRRWRGADLKLSNSQVRWLGEVEKELSKLELLLCHT